jgi:hypothetical protein
VFLVNSRLDLFTATHLLQWAPLLPKLRGHFAEFLRESYLAPLSILNHPTCVGFGYRSIELNVVRAFLGSQTMPLPRRIGSYSGLGSNRFHRLSTP